MESCFVKTQVLSLDLAYLGSSALGLDGNCRGFPAGSFHPLFDLYVEKKNILLFTRGGGVSTSAVLTRVRFLPVFSSFRVPLLSFFSGKC